MIVKATISDVRQLTEIALKSKSFWGYSNELLESWRNDLTVTSKMISKCTVFKFLVDDQIVGFYILNPLKEKSIELEMLFVLPEFIGKGIGKQLLQHSFEKALKLKVNSMTLLADPNAITFYESRGFYEVDKKESTIPGRFLSVLKKNLKE
jgi:N-acetylglutamate synthase-like GNAT family acetyltransferase